MSGSGSLRAPVAALLGGFCLAGIARGELASFCQPAAGTRLEAGETVEVSWLLDADRSTDFEEMELVLSLDGGRTFPLRVTREVSPTTRDMRWRVPALPAEHARLALRTGSRQDADSEAIRIVGPEFQIAVRPINSVEELFRVGGEWRTRETLDSCAAFPETSLAGSPAEEMDSMPAQTWASEPPKPTVAPVSSNARHSWSPVSKPARSIEPSTSFASPPDIPLRQ